MLLIPNYQRWSNFITVFTAETLRYTLQTRCNVIGWLAMCGQNCRHIVQVRRWLIRTAESEGGHCHRRGDPMKGCLMWLAEPVTVASRSGSAAHWIDCSESVLNPSRLLCIRDAVRVEHKVDLVAHVAVKERSRPMTVQPPRGRCYRAGTQSAQA